MFIRTSAYFPETFSLLKRKNNVPGHVNNSKRDQYIAALKSTSIIVGNHKNDKETQNYYKFEHYFAWSKEVQNNKKYICLFFAPARV